jgi:tRNA A-37 threonylcarbamoyl transferase component Bud32
MMEKLLTKDNLNYRFGFSRNLSDNQLKEILTHFRTQKTAEASISGGRAPVATAVIKGLGPVIIKQYLRGGIMKFILKNRYVKFGKPRSQVEFESMLKLRKYGIRAPEPVAFAYRGFPLYFAWLITREIEQSCTLAELNCQDINRVSNIMDKVIEQIDKLVECRFFHVDLHPGNILVDGDDNIYIIDFDKGHLSSTQKEQLYDAYYQRWRRAIAKHQLPKILDDMLLKGLNNLSGNHVII